MPAAGRLHPHSPRGTDLTVYRIERCPHCGKNIRQRTAEQNDGLHAAIDDVARQIDWPRGSGVSLDKEAWKRLLVAAWERTEGRNAEIYPAIDGHGFDVVVRRTSKMSKEQLSELYDFVLAQGSEWGVKWSKEAA